jgi:predicted RNA-binding Zn-ribbon protein involved in translation (DUF1610 family)
MIPPPDSTGRIQDAHGRWVTQLDPASLLVRGRFDVVEEPALHAIVEELEPGTARARRHLMLIIPGAIAAIAALVLLLYYFGDASFRKDLVSSLLNPAIMVPCIVSCSLVPWLAARKTRLRRAAYAMLKHHRCPHCGYNLHGLSTAPAAVCPECGCAWLIDDDAYARQLAATAPQTPAAARQRTIAAMLVLTGLTVLGVLAAIFLMLR